MSFSESVVDYWQIRRLEFGEMSWLAQFVKFCLLNEPCVLSRTFTKDWPVRQLWVREDGTPNFDYLRKHYGAQLVPITTESSCDPYYIMFNEFCNYCEKSNVSGDSEPLYLKDWHFQKSNGITMYRVPAMLGSDWVNCEDWTDDDDNPLRGDYRFVYFGVKNSWTEFHSDVMSSHSWSANICGRKLWYLVPPGNENFFLKNGNVVKDIRSEKDLWRDANVAVIVQNPGEIVFVPANWYHQVHNLDDAISINHNLINASNVQMVYMYLRRRLIDVQKEISHLSHLFTEQEMLEQEQIILGADARLNMPRLRCLLQMVVVDRGNGPMATCYICSYHIDPLDCTRNSECLKRFTTYCSCTVTTSICCDQFMKSFELSIAISMLNKMTKDGY
ncbi:JmjC domain protein [Dictyocaulus viviparus]|uniref:Jumonji domain-containing protein 4 n=1 Tax=Dictyocaulus viviparus TaxID=29172 RepID=A0A0D8XFZ2_DICVI|nr:JmjC domain protein [Dictyocaulus viviparus]